MMVIILVLLLGYFNLDVRTFVDNKVVNPIKNLTGVSATSTSTSETATSTTTLQNN